MHSSTAEMELALQLLEKLLFPHESIELPGYEARHAELRSELLTRFEEVSLSFTVEEMEIIKEALGHFPGLDLRNIILVRKRGNSYFDHYNKMLVFGPKNSYVHNDRAHFLFIALHELRHAEQFSKGMLTIEVDTPINNSVDGYMVWNGSERVKLRGEKVQEMLNNDLEGYQKLPWEADANGFASSVMGDYIPDDSYMAVGVKFGRIAF